MTETLYPQFNFFAENGRKLVEKFYEIKKDNILSLTNYNIRLPLESLIKNSEIKLVKNMIGQFKELKQEIEFLGYDYDTVKTDIEKIINDIITYANDISKGTLLCSSDLIKMKMFEKTRDGLSYEDINETIILKTIHKFVPKLIDLYREKTHDVSKNPLNEFVYEDFLNNYEKEKTVFLRITACEELLIFNKEDENPLFDNMEEFIKNEYLETLVSLPSLKLDKSYFTQSQIIAKLLMNYGFMIDETNIDPSEIIIKKRHFKGISEKAMNDFLSENIKDIFDKYDYTEPKDRMRIFSHDTSLIAEGSFFEVYKNEIEYINMRFNDFKEINYLNLNEYLKSIVSTFFNYHQMIFNQKIDDIIDKKVLENYSDFTNNLLSSIDDVTMNDNWEYLLSTQIGNIFRPDSNKRDNLLINQKISDIFSTQQAILSLTKSALETYLEISTGIDKNRLGNLIKIIWNNHLIDGSCLTHYYRTIRTLKTSRFPDELENSVSILTKLLLKSAYKKYVSDAQ